MSLYQIYRELRRVGQVTVGTANGRRGEMKYVAVCAAEDCGWSVEYDDVTPAMLAAQGHRCPVR
ncbi:mobile element transfer protein [Streptomyces sp. NBC_00038]|uniref:mobile element transfer protein n=1 Tax=Streptomyces sp. NBC_00038 TaxID=2903615 RepID=UPI00224CD380|nr:mobile element transfer protein [Streptomyces sp. NBC_00038]MCX5560756.1 Mobile element transfer [Streptomyces sp. NBC_00038]